MQFYFEPQVLQFYFRAKSFIAAEFGHNYDLISVWIVLCST